MPHPNSPTPGPFSSRKNSSQTKRERERDVFRVLCCFCLVFFCFLLHRRSLRESRKHTEVSRSISSSSSSSPASLFFSSSSSLIPHTRKHTRTSKKKTLANAEKKCSISRADEFLQIQSKIKNQHKQTKKKESNKKQGSKQGSQLAISKLPPISPPKTQQKRKKETNKTAPKTKEDSFQTIQSNSKSNNSNSSSNNEQKLMNGMMCKDLERKSAARQQITREQQHEYLYSLSLTTTTISILQTLCMYLFCPPLSVSLSLSLYVCLCVCTKARRTDSLKPSKCGSHQPTHLSFHPLLGRVFWVPSLPIPTPSPTLESLLSSSPALSLSLSLYWVVHMKEEVINKTLRVPSLLTQSLVLRPSPLLSFLFSSLLFCLPSLISVCTCDLKHPPLSNTCCP